MKTSSDGFQELLERLMHFSLVFPPSNDALYFTMSNGPELSSAAKLPSAQLLEDQDVAVEKEVWVHVCLKDFSGQIYSYKTSTF